MDKSSQEALKRKAFVMVVPGACGTSTPLFDRQLEAAAPEKFEFTFQDGTWIWSNSPHIPAEAKIESHAVTKFALAPTSGVALSLEAAKVQFVWASAHFQGFRSWSPLPEVSGQSLSLQNAQTSEFALSAAEEGYSWSMPS